MDFSRAKLEKSHLIAITQHHMSGTNIIILIVIMIVVCVFMYNTNRRRDEDRRVKRLREAFGQIPDKRMSAERYASVPAYDLRHRTDHSIDDITWNDLDLTALYHRMDCTQSAAGEEYLYHLLRTPAQDATEMRELVDVEAVRYFADAANEAQRVRLQRILGRLGHTGRYSLCDYLELLDGLGERSNVRNIICCLLPFASVGVMAVNVQVGVVMLIAAVCYNMVTYYKEKGEIDPFIVSFRYLLRLMEASDAICRERCDVLKEDMAVLAARGQEFAGFRRGSSILMNQSEMGSGNIIDMILDYVRILFHLDLIKFNSMLHAMRAGRTGIDEMLRIVGRLDAEIAIASFRQSLAVSCEPEFVDAADGIAYKALGLVHPLLASPVPNSIDVRRSILLTGSNASGKSTFLKSAAIAALLAQSVGVAPAERYRAPRWRIYSSMALRDSMQDGDSYFMVEIKSLKRIVDAASVAGANPVLCCIDEVLRGTNTIERIAASSEILAHLDATDHVLCIAATHDIELADLLTAYENYHFEETLDGKDVVFSYEILPGRAVSRNAIRLLSQIGFDDDITARAQERAAGFDQTGQWR